MVIRGAASTPQRITAVPSLALRWITSRSALIPVASMVGTWRIRGFVDKFPMFAGAYSFSLELLEKPHDDVLDVATAIIRVPGVTNKPEPITLPVTWAVDTQEPV